MYHANKFISYTLIFNMLNFEDEFILFYHLYPKPFVQLSVERKKKYHACSPATIVISMCCPFCLPTFSSPTTNLQLLARENRAAQRIKEAQKVCSKLCQIHFILLLSFSSSSCCIGYVFLFSDCTLTQL